MYRCRVWTTSPGRTGASRLAQNSETIRGVSVEALVFIGGLPILWKAALPTAAEKGEASRLPMMMIKGLIAAMAVEVLLHRPSWP